MSLMPLPDLPKLPELSFQLPHVPLLGDEPICKVLDASPPVRGPSLEQLQRRAAYGGRKGRSAARRIARIVALAKDFERRMARRMED